MIKRYTVVSIFIIICFLSAFIALYNGITASNEIIRQINEQNKYQYVYQEEIMIDFKDYTVKYEDLNNMVCNINESNIEKIYGNKVKIETGGGRVVIKNIVANELDIEGGAGEIIVENLKAEILDFEAGIGNAEVTAEITNRADIDSGVGRLELNLLGNKDNYMIIPSVGIGAVTVDNEKVVSKNVIGSGNQKISIDAGVGEVVVNFAQ